MLLLLVTCLGAARALSPSAVVVKRPAPSSDDISARRAFARDGLCVLEDFFDAPLFESVRRAAAEASARLTPETLESVAVGRYGCFLQPGDPVVRALSADATVARLRRVAGDERLAPADFPVELRRYPRGASMGWHKDEALYEEPQLECVLTLENSSDSETRWERADGAVASMWLPPNSLLVVRAEGASHGVTPVRSGDRLIAKYVLAAQPVVKLQAWYDNLASYRPGG
mmetsp:Transcript_17801/g.52943  ORF Transcript_17801/g.52943 Transcript_17801/m.52943 type:complete len:229 (-) Transcript_17801:22-708(-)